MPKFYNHLMSVPRINLMCMLEQAAERGNRKVRFYLDFRRGRLKIDFRQVGTRFDDMLQAEAAWPEAGPRIWELATIEIPEFRRSRSVVDFAEYVILPRLEQAARDLDRLYGG